MAETSSSKKLALQEFLNTVSISARDKWVVERLFAKVTDKKTQASWMKAIKAKGDISITASK